jgi:hypothetical protein
MRRSRCRCCCGRAKHRTRDHVCWLMSPPNAPRSLNQGAGDERGHRDPYNRSFSSNVYARICNFTCKKWNSGQCTLMSRLNLCEYVAPLEDVRVIIKTLISPENSDVYLRKSLSMWLYAIARAVMSRLRYRMGTATSAFCLRHHRTPCPGVIWKLLSYQRSSCDSQGSTYQDANDNKNKLASNDNGGDNTSSD